MNLDSKIKIIAKVTKIFFNDTFSNKNTLIDQKTKQKILPYLEKGLIKEFTKTYKSIDPIKIKNLIHEIIIDEKEKIDVIYWDKINIWIKLIRIRIECIILMNG